MGRYEQIIKDTKIEPLFSKLGICLFDGKGQIKTFYQVLTELNDIWDSLTERQKSLIGEIIYEE